MKRHALAVGMLAVTLGLPSGLPGHAGEDHSGESLAMAAITATGDQPLYVPVETQILTKIKTAVVSRGSLPRTLRVLGRTQIRPEREAILTTAAEGRLVAAEGAPPSLGDVVKRGQVLAIVEETISAAEMVTIAAERARVAGELKQAEADLALAQREHRRLDNLEGVVTGQSIDAAKANVDVTQARLDGLVDQLVHLGSATASGVLAQKRRVLEAPIDGIIDRFHVTLGENVGPEKPLYHIVDLSELLVEADVFENDIAAVLASGNARFTAEAFPGESFAAKLVSRGTTVDSQTRALHMLFAVENTGYRLFAGMFGQVYIETGEQVEGLTIPAAALIDLDGRQVVYVKKSGEVFFPVGVRILVRGKDATLVEPLERDALKEGERVVVQGAYQVRMSQPVSQPVGSKEL